MDRLEPGKGTSVIPRVEMPRRYSHAMLCSFVQSLEVMIPGLITTLEGVGPVPFFQDDTTDHICRLAGVRPVVRRPTRRRISQAIEPLRVPKVCCRPPRTPRLTPETRLP